MDVRLVTQTTYFAMGSKIRTIWRDRQAYLHRYFWPFPSFRREFVVMIDGKMTHGGLTDRFRHILSIFSYCKQYDIPFRIYYTYPCPLQDILVPNEYEWRIQDKELHWHFMDSAELDLYVDEEGKDEIYNAKHLAILDKAALNRKQYHVYGNAFFGKGQYRPLFDELFKPSSFFDKGLSKIRATMTLPYEAVSLRFQMLLGDWEEGRFEVLDEYSREVLIQKCVDKIDELWQTHYFSTQKVLVTSDSALFLKHISEREYVYTIPGEMEHMDYTHNSDIEMNAKPFVDLFLLKGAQRLTLLKTGKMYKSGFPAFAAELGGKPFNIFVF